ncbi:MAG: response regulator [Candidatus Omnitrophota bacterium]
MAKIMVVDDEREILSLLNVFLKKKGFEVVLCQGGKPAIIEVIKNNAEIDLVILDRRMPDVDGFVVLEEIRKIEKYIPVIMLAGSLGGDTKKIPVDDFLMKPIDLNKLLEKVEKYLRN